MKTMTRRAFVATGATLPVAAALGAATAEPGPLGVDGTRGFGAGRTTVNFTGDGQSLSPQEYAQVLGSILAEAGIEPDYYSLCGVVSELEKKMAAATTNLHEVFGLEGVGVVEKGGRADLVIVDSDPTLDLRALREPALVVAAGRLVRR